jgi:MSHA biogenesis protein MshJ
MKLPASYINASSRFNAMSLRERGMVAIAILALVVLAWDQMLMDPLRDQRTLLTQETEDVEKSIRVLSDSVSGRAEDNPLAVARERQSELTRALSAVDAELESASAGLIPPPRMVEALRDMLDRQRGLRLVSVRNMPVTSLVPASTGSNGAQSMQGPFVHPLEIVVEGNYLDVLRYLQAVEALPWRFYWQALELKQTEYPTNRVRIRLNTLSMDKEWLGV